MGIMNIPKTVVIVPYRDRAAHRTQFLQVMKENLSHLEDCQIFFAHQADQRPFNRGAMKNLGFIAMKVKYPQHYKDMTFVFHDVDCWHREKGAIPYTTDHGVVSHYYGATYALGGMFAIKGADFDKTGGFPNFWGWGLEDNTMYDRALKAGLTVRRSPFYLMSDPNIARPFDGFKRLIAKRESVVYKFEQPDDITALINCAWTINGDMIHVTHFLCGTAAGDQEYGTFDIRQGGKLKIPAGQRRRPWGLNSIIRR